MNDIAQHPTASLSYRRALVAIVRRPDLWRTAIGAAIDNAPNRWWLRRPFLPLPDENWLRFRMVTAYGGDGTNVEQSQATSDLVEWLEWRRELR